MKGPPPPVVDQISHVILQMKITILDVSLTKNSISQIAPVRGAARLNLILATLIVVIVMWGGGGEGVNAQIGDLHVKVVSCT